ncbi:hypothetical protein JT359_05610 [Candidatus Poribacteria bacterium]|nr:hypothetical protein [Candidatus Poribacteria bacterium]
MAKKKTRTTNVARKREKRNRDRKSKSKQIAAEKHHRVPLEKMDEERLHSFLLKSYDLLDEPEIQKVHFDLDMVETELLDLIKNAKQTDSNVEEDAELVSNIFEEHEIDILSRLITSEFRKQLQSALNTCENRLKKLGKYERAEVAYVAQSLFEIVPANVMAGHPIIQHIGKYSIQLLVEDRIISDELSAVSDYLPDVQEIDYDELLQNESLPSLFSDALSKKIYKDAEDKQVLTENNSESIHNTILNPVSEYFPQPLPAKALYKNFEGIEIRESLNELDGQCIEVDFDTLIEYINKKNEIYIIISENRLQLHAESNEKLATAMKKIETHCQSALMFLAKTIDEGGENDGTE